jgi:hypothetical protein
MLKIVGSVTPPRSFPFFFSRLFVYVDVYPSPSAQDFSSTRTVAMKRRAVLEKG